ncbi:putative asparagine--tRNA ligase, cytoplasmic [Dictyocoela muelleri]|nr:putative asparagine--tRNA ligase, cytoplasmic [Dictyocoela muelleri]
MSEEICKEIESLKIEDYEKKQLINITKNDIGKKIKTFGWVKTSRCQKKHTFIDLISGFKTMKCFYPKKVDFELTRCTSMVVYGVVKENYEKSTDKSEFEFHIDYFEIFGSVAPSFPINSESSQFTRLEYGHLALRTKERGLFLKARSCLMKIIRDYYWDTKHIEITPPTLVQTQVEGGSTLFKLKYFNEDAYLTQSSQLYLETVVPVAGKAFCIMPSYRAEKSSTTRHIAEYTHVEAELADIVFDDLINEIEQLLTRTMSRFYKEMKNDILEIYPDFEFHKIPDKKFKRISYSDAIKLLNDEKYKKDDGSKFELGDDIPDHAERFLVMKIGDGLPVFLTHFPSSQKPFYAKRADNPDFVEAVDVLFPGIGEIVGGSMRCDDYEELMSGFKREGIDPAPYYWYTDMLRYGPSPHGGYGLGFERLLMGLMKYENVNMACLYPRFVTRCTP